MQTRPKYSTGFRVWVAGVIAFLLGLLAITHGEKVIGDPLAVVGVVLIGWLRYPSSWEKTWPDDFPRLARALGIEPQPERWAPTRRFWDTASPRSRRKRSVLVTAGAVVWMGWGLTNPLDWRGYGSHTSAVLIGALVAGLGLREYRRARRDRSTGRH